MSKTTNTIIKNTGFLYIKMGITVFFSLYTTRLILNALGVVDYGVFGIVGGTISMLGFLNSSMSGSTQRFISYYLGKGKSEELKAIFNNSIILHALIAVVVVIFLELALYPLFNGVLNIPPERQHAARDIYQFMIVSTFFTIISVPYDAVINAHENMLYYAMVGVLESTFKLIIAIFVVYTIFDKLIIYGLLMSLLAVLLLMIKYVYCRRHYSECRTSLKRYYSYEQIREQLYFAGWNFVGTTGALLGNNGGDIVMNHFFGPAINAAGSVGSQLRGQMMVFSNNMLKALNPVIIKKEGSGDHQSMMKFSISGSKLSYLLFAVFAMPFVIEAPYILRVWLSNVPDWAVCFSRFQMLTGLGEQLTITLGTALVAIGRIKNYNIFSGLAHFMPLFIYWFLYANDAPPYWTYFITFVNFVFVIGGYTIFLCEKECGLEAKIYIRQIICPSLLCTIVSLMIGFSVVCMIPESFTRLILVVIATDLTFVLLFYRFLLSSEESGILKDMVLKVINRVNKRENE